MNADEELKALQQKFEALTLRIQVREDIEEIKQITYRYCRAADKKDGLPPNYVRGVHDCFTEDGIWDGGVLGKVQGLEGFEKHWGNAYQEKMLKMINHMALNPIIEVSGDEATGDFHLLGQLTVGGEALWTAGRYHNLYSRTSKGWRIKVMHYDPWMWSRHLEGWAKERFATTASELSG